MKKFYFTLFAALLFSLPVLANNVIVKGYVTYSNGTPAANHPVYIQTDSLTSASGCYQYNVVYTNANGYYADTFNCTGSIVKVKIQVQDCNGSILTETPQVNTATNIVERNFTLSCNLQQTCHADFNFSVQQLTAAFVSTASSGAGSAISSFHWSFGDGTIGTGPNPVHNYPASGSYSVKLVIESSNTCRDSVIKVVNIFNTAGTCHAAFHDTMIAPNKFYFLSGGSSSSDSIVQRIWKFGDGTGATGNQVNVDHIYQVSGTYTVCLKIVSASGCVDSTCKTITATAPTASCVASFNFQVGNHNAYFNSSASTGSTPADAILTRYWNFGDGSVSTTNVVAPVHTYAAAGTYQVCLQITTASGCQKTECHAVTIVDSNCHANFTYSAMSAGAVQFTNTSSTLGTNAQYYWTFGNSGGSTAVNPVYTFVPGTYNVCLRVYNTATGCADSICKTIVINTPPPPTNCEAVYSFTGLPVTSPAAGFTLQFGSSASHATSATGDSIHERIWIWGDGSTTTGNVVYPIHTYTTPATYNVCLVIRSVSGCSDTTCKSITVPMPNQVTCQSKFTYENLPFTTPPNRPVKFNSTTSAAGPGDSIIYRRWTFGDGTTLISNNPIVTHNYTQPGTYTVCLTIKSALNCEKTECKVVVVTQVTSACVPHFNWQRTAPKQASFNSAMSWVPVNDTIIQRTWNFGDATPLLTGNVVAPVHNYLNFGIYTVSLRIKTVHNCEQTFYAPVIVQDSINNATGEPIKIISIFPNPASVQTQVVVWSLHNNVQAELAIYDVYGSKKWSINKVLLQGNNITVVPTSFLLPGPYYLKVTTVYGIKSRPFFKY